MIAIRWYVMLFPTSRDPLPLMQELAALTGGTAVAEPHVTIGMFDAADEHVDLAAPLRGLTGPPVTIRAGGPYNDLAADPGSAGHALLLRVARTPALAWWYRAIRATLRPLAPPVWVTWELARPHLYGVERTARPFGEVSALLAGRTWEVEFGATTLLVSQRLGGRYVARLEQPLTGGAGHVSAMDPERVRE